MCNCSEKLLVRVDARAAELEDCRMRLCSPYDSSNRFRNIFHIGRLQSGPAAAEHRIDRKLAKELEDGGEKCVVRSEHHSRGAQEVHRRMRPGPPVRLRRAFGCSGMVK